MKFCLSRDLNGGFISISGKHANAPDAFTFFNPTKVSKSPISSSLGKSHSRSFMDRWSCEKSRKTKKNTLKLPEGSGAHEGMA